MLIVELDTVEMVAIGALSVAPILMLICVCYTDDVLTSHIEVEAVEPQIVKDSGKLRA
jgi:hypothetical protein